MCYGEHDHYSSRDALGIHHKDRDSHPGAIACVQKGIVCITETGEACERGYTLGINSNSATVLEFLT